MKNSIKNIIKTIRIAACKIRASIMNNAAAEKLAGQDGQFVVEHAAVFAIILVIAAIVIALLITFLQGDFKTLITGKISDLFN